MSIKEIYQTVFNKFLLLFVFSDLHATKFTLMLAELTRGAGLLWVGHTFNREPYAVMEYVIPNEHIWGMLWLMGAGCRFYILASGEYHTRFAFWFTGASALFWWFTTLSIYFSTDTVPASVGSSVALSLAASWLFIRVGWIPSGMRRKYADAS